MRDAAVKLKPHVHTSASDGSNSSTAGVSCVNDGGSELLACSSSKPSASLHISDRSFVGACT